MAQTTAELNNGRELKLDQSQGADKTSKACAIEKGSQLIAPNFGIIGNCYTI